MQGFASIINTSKKRFELTHNPKVVGSNPALAIPINPRFSRIFILQKLRYSTKTRPIHKKREDFESSLLSLLVLLSLEYFIQFILCFNILFIYFMDIEVSSSRWKITNPCCYCCIIYSFRMKHWSIRMT